MGILVATPANRTTTVQLAHKEYKNVLAMSIDAVNLVSRMLHFEHLRDTNRNESMFTPMIHKLIAQPL